MNESAGDQITELLNDLHLSDADDLDAPSDDADADEESPIRPTREGLPGSFRMRHDAHYVDELMSRTTDGSSRFDRDDLSRQAPEPAPAPTRFDRPGSAEAVAAAPDAALSLIASRLESVVAHAGAMSPQQAGPSLIAQAVHAEFGRVARLARAAAILQDREAPVRRSVSARDLADRVMQVSAPVARMAGFDCELTVDNPEFAVLAESALVVQAIAGTVDAVVDLLLVDPRRPSPAGGHYPAPRISISVQSMKVRPALIFDVICPALFIGSAHAERFFDNAGDDYRAAPAAGILVAAAACVARAHGGRADVKRHHAIGATITYVFPLSVADYGLT